MRRRYNIILIAVGIPVAVVGCYALISSIVGFLSITTDKAVYSRGETITFTVRNNGLSTLQFGTSGLGFRIMNLDTNDYVQQCIAVVSAAYSMEPLTSKTIRWDQTDSNCREYPPVLEQVEPGNYTASVRTSKTMAEVKFRIS
jgi:hypothetical protein